MSARPRHLPTRMLPGLAVTVTLAITGVLVPAARTLGAVPPSSCASSKRVINGGKPPAFAKKLFGFFRTQKAVAVPTWVRQQACIDADIFPSGYLPGALDLHQARAVSDPADRKGAPLLVIPGERGIALVFRKPRGILYYPRCWVAKARVMYLYGTTLFGNPVENPVDLVGLVTDEVTSATGSGGTLHDGIDVERTAKVTHNTFALHAPYGLAKVTLARRSGGPRILYTVGQALPAAKDCPTINESEGIDSPGNTARSRATARRQESEHGTMYVKH